MFLNQMETELLKKTYNKDISIIIYNNNSDNLIKCIKKIAKQDYDFSRIEIVIETTKLDELLKKTINKIIKTCTIKEHNDLNVAKAYNEGIKITEGKFICFINSNIILNSINIFKKIVKKNKKILIANMYYNDIEEELISDHIFNIEENRTVRMDISSGFIKTCLESVFIRREYMFDLSFDEKFNEEAPLKFLIELLRLNKKYYASTIKITTLVPYEDNISKNSIQYKKEWYNESLKKWTSYAKEFDFIPIFIQEYLLYIIYAKYNCNLNDRNKNVLTEDEYNDFIEKTRELLKYINDRTILQFKENIEFNKSKHLFKVPRQLRYYFYKLKEGTNNKKYISNYKFFEQINKEPKCVIDLLEETIIVYALNYKNNELIFDCSLSIKDYLDEEDINLRIMYGNEIIEYQKIDIYNKEKVFGKTYSNKYMIQFKVNIKNNYNDLKAFLIFDEKAYQIKFNFMRIQSRLTNIDTSYWNCDNFTVQNKIDRLIISKRKAIKTLALELKFQFTKIKIKDLEEKEIVRTNKRIRILYYLTKPFLKNKHIWITFDKLYKAGDNGEYIYQYGLKNKKNIYYVIKKNSVDYYRLTKQNRKHILDYRSLKHKLYSLHSEVILDTHANAASYCGYDGIERTVISGLFNPEIICIQHGLTMQDIAQFQNRLFDNIKLYCCASKYELQNLSKPIYGYDQNQIKLTGLARYDGLKKDDKRFILITPTWRKNVVNSNIVHHQKKHNNNFINSIYFKIYNSLINNRELIECAKKNNYKIVYLLHPAMSAQIDDFDKNDYVKIIQATGELNYEKILTEASLMITDYSGVQYDFGYQRKPLIYYHPEELPPHYDTGMMDYQKLGFGEICKNEKHLVNTICNYMENNCKMKSEYEKRANDFFAYNDYNSCKRIIECIDKYLQEKDEK